MPVFCVTSFTEEEDKIYCSKDPRFGLIDLIASKRELWDEFMEHRAMFIPTEYFMSDVGESDFKTLVQAEIWRQISVRCFEYAGKKM